MDHAIDPVEHFKALLEAQYQRISDRIAAEEQKAILRDDRIIERVESLKRSIERIDLAEIRRVVLAEAAQVAQREAMAAADARVNELRMSSGRTSGWISGNEGLVRILVTSGLAWAAALLAVFLMHTLGKG